MQFFNTKEDVIDIQLTQYGKYLLSEGAFKPVFYAFYDDDILYNREQAGPTEKQNEAQTRILSTPRLKTQYSVVSIAETYDQTTDFLKKLNDPNEGKLGLTQDPHLSQKILSSPLLNCSVNSDKAPYYKVFSMEAEIESATDTVVEKGVVQEIPQIEITSNYEVVRDASRVEPIPYVIQDEESFIDLSGDEVIFLDKSRIYLKKEDIVLDIKEEEASEFFSLFDIELYEVVTDPEGEKLVRLETNEDVNKYFEIIIDGDLPPQRISPLIDRAGNPSSDMYYKRRV